jgi:Zn-dependent protease with chaperone function
MNLSTLYPKSPQLSDFSFLNPTDDFKRNVVRVMTAILIFIGVYALLIGVGILMLTYMLPAGLSIMAFSIEHLAGKAIFLGLLIGVGVMFVAVMFALFLIKFMFVVNKNVRASRIEIKREDEPLLFDFIEKIADEVQTHRPNKIFISPDVNACVFYNSSFWSMFLPIRKNLEIGLGLVNTLTIDEFKAVLAHEFGHFSQKSMKLGSYVYTTNRVIYNLTYNYDKWDSFVDGMRQTDWWLVQIFGNIILWFANQVRKLLHAVYKFMNLRYMSLSREMEYHADLVATSVAGGNHIVNALRKLELGDFSYQKSVQLLNELAVKEKNVENVYAAHQYIMQENAPDFNHEIIEKDTIRFAKNTKSEGISRVIPRVNFKDQWASHPSFEEREQNVNKVKIELPLSNDSSWLLFTKPEHWQLQMTKALYVENNIESKPEFENTNGQSLISQYKEVEVSKKFPPVYKGFYDSHYISIFDCQEALKNHKALLHFDDIFNTENVHKIKRLFANNQDIAVLSAIKNGQIGAESFDFEGEKYEKHQLDDILNQLQEENEATEKWLIELDAKAFVYHYQVIKGQNIADSEAYLKRFMAFQKWQELNNEAPNMAQKMQEAYHDLQHGEGDSEQRSRQFVARTAQTEDIFKTFILDNYKENLSQLTLDEAEVQQNFKDYFDITKRKYLTTDMNGFSMDNFVSLYNIMFGVVDKLQFKTFNEMRDLVLYQKDFVEKN